MRNYDDPVYKEVRKQVLQRDKHCCQMPDCGSKKRLHVHHIIPWSKAAYLRFDLSNLISLCKECHESIKDMEHIYQSIFMRIVRDNENNS
jgi:5-methylcytosine-specific restriction endonuclease McrA